MYVLSNLFHSSSNRTTNNLASDPLCWANQKNYWREILHSLLAFEEEKAVKEFGKSEAFKSVVEKANWISLVFSTQADKIYINSILL